MQIVPLSAFSDNYIWAVCAGDACAIVDPGDATPVEHFIEARGLRLDAILLTHHHDDHIGGVAALAERYRPLIIAPADPRIPQATRRVAEAETVELEALGMHLKVIEVPGHTRTHVAFHDADHAALFCGDTLFGGGCGRLFEGSPAQMLDSLGRLAALPADTRVYCAHEYTLSNLRFGLAVEPDNLALQDRMAVSQTLRERGLPTLPSDIATELATNPFLRAALPAVQAAAQRHHGAPLSDSLAAFTVLREWKNHF